MVEDKDIRKLLPIAAALRKLVEHARVSETRILDQLTRIGLQEYANEWERQARELEARIVFLKSLSQVDPEHNAEGAETRPPQAA